MISVRLVAVLSFLISSCALLKPTASIELSRVPSDYSLDLSDTTKTILMFDSRINFDFDLNGSDRITVRPGFSQTLASGISPGWFYMDVIGATMWVRGLPVYLFGGDSVLIDVDNDHLSLDGAEFFTVSKEKSTTLPFVPSLSISCVGCTARPQLKFDNQQVNYLPPWIAIDPGWHTIEIYSPFDNVELYYRTLFDNYSITRFTLYPFSMKY